MYGYGTLVLGRPVPIGLSRISGHGTKGIGSMAVNLTNRSFLTLLDFTPEEIHFLLDLAASLEQAKHDGTENPRPTF